MFCAGEIQIFAQDFEQGLVRRERDLSLIAIECEFDMGLLLH